MMSAEELVTHLSGRSMQRLGARNRGRWNTHDSWMRSHGRTRSMHHNLAQDDVCTGCFYVTNKQVFWEESEYINLTKVLTSCCVVCCFVHKYQMEKQVRCFQSSPIANGLHDEKPLNFHPHFGSIWIVLPVTVSRHLQVIFFRSSPVEPSHITLLWSRKIAIQSPDRSLSDENPVLFD